MGCLIVNSTLLVGETHPGIAKEIKEVHRMNEKLMTDFLKSEKRKGRFSGDPKSMSQYFNAVVQGMAVLHRSSGNYSALKNIAANAMNAWPH